jgi:hypothetical protein
MTMPKMQSVPKSQWREFFDRFSGALTSKRVEIEVASLDLGDQIVAEWMPLQGITYDSADDLLDVALDQMNHLIRHPREIVVEEGASGVETVAVSAEDGTKQVLRLKQPMMLPTPTGGRSA